MGSGNESLLHTSFRVRGLVAIAFWSMVLVVLSGVFGRYVYVRIPKTIQGHFLSLQALQDRRREAVEGMRKRFDLDEGTTRELLTAARCPTPLNPGHALVLALRWDLGRRRLERNLREVLGGMKVPSRSHRELARLLREEGRRELQITLLRPFQRLFRYWHVFHLPLAIVMVLILAVHVTVAVMFGYAWVF